MGSFCCFVPPEHKGVMENNSDCFQFLKNEGPENLEEQAERTAWSGRNRGAEPTKLRLAKHMGIRRAILTATSLMPVGRTDPRDICSSRQQPHKDMH